MSGHGFFHLRHDDFLAVAISRAIKISGARKIFFAYCLAVVLERAAQCRKKLVFVVRAPDPDARTQSRGLYDYGIPQPQADRPRNAFAACEKAVAFHADVIDAVYPERFERKFGKMLVDGKRGRINIGGSKRNKTAFE